MVARTKWLPERNGCPNEMVARTKWLPERNGCPHFMVALTAIKLSNKTPTKTITNEARQRAIT
ncbi:MAG: hypothetical protein DRR08_09845 [Candidatus Parabeggiatoa sp. nov. 2]|nr:MAG: hypothetical protein DRR08_09845 [Gammaproteobacteria bacterium]